LKSKDLIQRLIKKPMAKDRALLRLLTKKRPRIKKSKKKNKNKGQLAYHQNNPESLPPLKTTMAKTTIVS